MRRIIVPLLLGVVSFALGVVGYLDQYPGQGWDAAYFSLSLFSLGYDLEKITWKLELARWLAPLAAATTVLSIITLLFENFSAWVVIHMKDSVAVYGNTPMSETLVRDLKKTRGTHRIVAIQRFMPAHTHVIMFGDDEQNLSFISTHRNRFRKNDRIYLQLEDFDLHSLQHDEIICYPFSASELTAQLYWNQYAEWLCESCYDRNTVKLCFIGDGIIAQKLVQHALMYNLYSLSQRIEYHLFGNWREFNLLHSDWGNVSSPNDTVIFHTEDWFEDISLLGQMDRIIVCSNDTRSNLCAVHQINTLVPVKAIDVYVPNVNGLAQIFSENTKIFGSYDSFCTDEFILKEKIIQSGKALNESYRKEYGGKPWEQLDAFTRQSNICAARFQKVDIPLIEKKLAHLSEDDQDRVLAEIEHIRWSRYHYLHNWQQKAGEKDSVNRTHGLLVAFNELSPEEQLKNVKQVRRQRQELRTNEFAGVG